eukprot:EG_transcript_1752
MDCWSFLDSGSYVFNCDGIEESIPSWISKAPWAPSSNVNQQVDAVPPTEEFDFICRSNWNLDHYVFDSAGKSEAAIADGLRDYVAVLTDFLRLQEQRLQQLLTEQAALERNSVLEWRWIKKAYLQDLRPFFTQWVQRRHRRMELALELKHLRISIVQERLRAATTMLRSPHGALPFEVTQQRFFVYPAALLAVHPGPAMLTRRVAEAEQQEKAARMRYTAIKAAQHALKLEEFPPPATPLPSSGLFSPLELSPRHNGRLWAIVHRLPGIPMGPFPDIVNYEAHAAFSEYVHYQYWDSMCVDLITLLDQWAQCPELLAPPTAARLQRRVSAFAARLSSAHLRLAGEAPLALRQLAHQFVLQPLGARLWALEVQRPANEAANRAWQQQATLLRREPPSFWGIPHELWPEDGQKFYADAIHTIGFLEVCVTPHEMVLCLLATVQSCVTAAANCLTCPGTPEAARGHPSQPRSHRRPGWTSRRPTPLTNPCLVPGEPPKGLFDAPGTPNSLNDVVATFFVELRAALKRAFHRSPVPRPTLPPTEDPEEDCPLCSPAIAALCDATMSFGLFEALPEDHVVRATGDHDSPSCMDPEAESATPSAGRSPLGSPQASVLLDVSHDDQHTPDPSPADRPHPASPCQPCVLGADALFPILSCVLIQAAPSTLPTCLEFIRRYLPEADLDGELDYCVTMVHACIHHVAELCHTADPDPGPCAGCPLSPPASTDPSGAPPSGLSAPYCPSPTGCGRRSLPPPPAAPLAALPGPPVARGEWFGPTSALPLAPPREHEEEALFVSPGSPPDAQLHGSFVVVQRSPPTP